ncbi:MAG: hypothetical protein KUG77_29370, partial [Nannocystaceae bacterium]|nr:hypothetical protein [Nannocystaceae bacterium]
MDLTMEKLVLGMVLVGGLWATPTAAKACSCGGTTEVGPSGELPENAAVMFREQCGGGGTATVQVDGVPAELVFGAHSDVFPWGNYAWVEPTPEVGQSVTVTLDN